MSGNIVSDVNTPTSSVGGGGSPISGGQKAAIALLVVAIVLAVILLRGGISHKAEPEKALQMPPTAESGADFKPPPLAQTSPAALPLPKSEPQPFSLGVPQADPEQIARNSDILGGGAGASSRDGGTQSVLDGERGSGTDSTPLGKALKPTLLEGTTATVLPHPLMTITMGTQIPCTPQDPITSDAPGMVVCIVPVDIRGQEVGPNHHSVVLLDAGTKIVGTEQATMMQGHNRLFILWQRAQTPRNVIINLDSPAADEIGEAGLGGDLNTHFWQRFGGAMMLSFIDAGLQAAAQFASNTGGNNSLNFSQFNSGGSNAASIALQNTINIPPTLHRDQALPATVFVARDLDFSGVYDLVSSR